MRAAGVLMPVFSLPNAQGIGTFGKESYAFADWLKKAGQSYWQILPLGPTGYGDSPYQPFSTFAGNPYLIDLEAFPETVLPKEKRLACDLGSGSYGEKGGDAPRQEKLDGIDYGKLYTNKMALLFDGFQVENYIGIESHYPDFTDFCHQNASWLSDYALFRALKEAHGGAPWYEWETPLRMRRPDALEEARRTYGHQIRFYEWLQYHFSRQWKKLKKYVNGLGIQFIGDLPIYVALDSADAWSHPELFRVDGDGRPTFIAGVPPDAFSATGQLWGNPVYNWDYHKQTGYAWWIERVRHAFTEADVLRLDHFRGFDAFYCVPAGDATAEHGHWEDGPGAALFDALKRALPGKKLIAEDLGILTDRVRSLLAQTGYPGMKVLEFAFSADGASAYLPHRFEKNCVVYTGTHDNEPLRAWFETMPEADLAFLLDYLDLKEEQEAVQQTEADQQTEAVRHMEADRQTEAEQQTEAAQQTEAVQAGKETGTCSAAAGCQRDASAAGKSDETRTEKDETDTADTAQIRKEGFGDPTQGDGKRSIPAKWLDRMIRAAYAGVEDTVIVPFQDWKGLSADARINAPATFGQNWKWRMQPGMADEALAKRILHLTKLYGRLNAGSDEV